MAQKTIVQLLDDLDESEASETVPFALDGVSYEIDLNDTHASQLRDALAQYVGAARRISGARRATRSSASAAAGRGAGRTNGGTDNAAIRAWAKSQGMNVSERGRLSRDIVDAYHEAH